jgi:hypothetical protein
MSLDRRSLAGDGKEILTNRHGGRFEYVGITHQISQAARIPCSAVRGPLDGASGKWARSRLIQLFDFIYPFEFV